MIIPLGFYPQLTWLVARDFIDCHFSLVQALSANYNCVVGRAMQRYYSQRRVEG
jgi:hypothetical protein